jgi:XRE family transcriptional regulator, regulator of sulfur utilization
MTLRKIIGENIRRLRQEKGWSQEKLAVRCKLSHNYIARLERGEMNPGLDSLEKLANGLGTQVRGLFDS